jgi:hypothetical protein
MRAPGGITTTVLTIKQTNRSRPQDILQNTVATPTAEKQLGPKPRMPGTEAAHPSKVAREIVMHYIIRPPLHTKRQSTIVVVVFQSLSPTMHFKHTLIVEQRRETCTSASHSNGRQEPFADLDHLLHSIVTDNAIEERIRHAVRTRHQIGLYKDILDFGRPRRMLLLSHQKLNQLVLGLYGLTCEFG